MAASPIQSVQPTRRSETQIVQDLLKLQKATHKISSTLEIDELMASAVDNARRFRREQKVNEAVAREAAEARIVQEALFPKASPFAPGFSVQGRSLPAGAVGGDWYDFIPLSDGKWGIVLADVAGKGMAAALLMSATRAALRSMADTCFGPGGVLQKRPSPSAT